MLLVRSVLFNTAFYTNLIVRMIVLSPIYFLMPRKAAYRIPKAWAASCNWLMAKIVGATFEIEGLENVPEGGCIFAPKHQSAWDTVALLPWQRDPVYILKRELMWIPLFGWYAAKQKMIPVNRGARGKVMVDVMNRTKEEMANNRQLIIYPEGTRRPPGPSRNTATASPASIATSGCPSCRSSPIGACSGVAASSSNIPAISRSASCRRSRRAWIRMLSTPTWSRRLNGKATNCWSKPWRPTRICRCRRRPRNGLQS